MKNHPDFRDNHQRNKLYIIFSTNTIIQPLTMMIKHLHTSIAFLAMEGVLAHEGITGFAEEFMSSRIK